MNREEWENGIKAWENVKKQALIDLEQANLYIEAIQNKIKTLPEEEKGE